MAAKYYERATQLDPSYALAWVGLSRARNWQANVGLIPAADGHRLAREAVDRALALNPNLAQAHTQMGRIKQQVDFDWAGAHASFQRAVALDPGNPEVVRTAAFPAAMVGRRMLCRKSSSYAMTPYVRFWIRLRTTRLAGKRSRMPH